MPAVYAHNTFGVKVREKLKPEIKELLNKYNTQFKIGLQGPDLFFYYKPYLISNNVIKIGVNLHNNSFKDFLENLIPVIMKKGTDSKEYAYVLGFICHFTLDSSCHPYIYNKVKALDFNHIEMEAELDKFLLCLNDINPLSFPAHTLIPFDNETVDTISNVFSAYEEITDKIVLKALKSFRFYKKLLVAPTTFKRNSLNLLMKISGLYEYIQGHLFKATVNPKSHLTSPKLLMLYEEAIDKAVNLVEDFDFCINNGLQLSKSFDRNFK